MSDLVIGKKFRVIKKNYKFVVQQYMGRQTLEAPLDSIPKWKTLRRNMKSLKFNSISSAEQFLKDYFGDNIVIENIFRKEVK